MSYTRYVLFVVLAAGLAAAAAVLHLRTEGTSLIYYKDKAIVLVYHDIRQMPASEEAGASTLGADRLEDHLMMLESRGFQIISMDAFAGFMLEGRSIPPNAVILTFDDGYESFYSEAFPILKRFGASASNFIVGISSDLFNPDAEPHLTWEQMRELKSHGMGIYSHTYNLHRMVPADRTGSEEPALTARMHLEQKRRSETEPEYRRRIFSDLTFLEKRFEQELGRDRSLLAFPYGSYDEIVLDEGAKAGIELFFTVEEGINVAGSRIVKRINAGEPYMTSDYLWNRLTAFF